MNEMEDLTLTPTPELVEEYVKLRIRLDRIEAATMRQLELDGDRIELVGPELRRRGVIS